MSNSDGDIDFNVGGSIVLIVGGGGREHALALSLLGSENVAEVHVSPGNAGTAQVATNHAASASDVEAQVELARKVRADLVVVGPEAPLVSGLADRLRGEGILCFGPDADNAMLEGSKLRAKQTMRELGVPTADFHVLDQSSDIDAALDDFPSNPWVIKRDVLAGGKGVVVTADREEAKEFISQSIQSDDLVLLEDFLPGEEASMLVIMDESAAICLPPSQDHKRVGEGDIGLNTGGMGAYCPAPVITDEVREKVMERIVGPMHIGLSSQVNPYRGVLYVGLMIDSRGDPYVVEFNVRFGDPECQVTLPLISSDVYLMLAAAAAGKLETYEARFSHGHCLAVVLAAEGYPGPPAKGREISGHGLSSSEEAWIIHAGTDLQDGKLVSTGGRVLSVTGYGNDLAAAALQAYSVISEIDLEGSHYRRDIGFRAL